MSQLNLCYVMKSFGKIEYFSYECLVLDEAYAFAALSSNLRLWLLVWRTSA
ncbi:hypothetical protein ACM1ZW_20820 [Pseudomonas sp. NFX71]|uniref:hypothetical protein n=1 Tax=Pseudomonas sp. NFX71 TaxID=3399121 RepID=UPI003A88DC15